MQDTVTVNVGSQRLQSSFALDFGQAGGTSHIEEQLYPRGRAVDVLPARAAASSEAEAELG